MLHGDMCDHGLHFNFSPKLTNGRKPLRVFHDTVHPVGVDAPRQRQLIGDRRCEHRAGCLHEVDCGPRPTPQATRTLGTTATMQGSCAWEACTHGEAKSHDEGAIKFGRPRGSSTTAPPSRPLLRLSTRQSGWDRSQRTRRCGTRTAMLAALSRPLMARRQSYLKVVEKCAPHVAEDTPGVLRSCPKV